MGEQWDVGEAAGPWGARGQRCEFDHGRRLGKAAVLDLAHELAGLLVELFRAIDEGVNSPPVQSAALTMIPGAQPAVVLDATWQVPYLRSI